MTEPQFAIRVTHVTGAIVILNEFYSDEDVATAAANAVALSLAVNGFGDSFTAVDVQQLGTFETLLEMVS